jgi:uncharacterized protein DUF4177
MREGGTPAVTVGRGSRRREGVSVTQRYEYKVETIRSSVVGDKMDSGAVEKSLNDRARGGWQLKSLTATQVKGRIGPGGTEGLLAVFERPIGAA